MTSSVPPINPRNQDYRIGDTERQKAMDDLGKHFAAGRLDITEYDNRLTNVAEATMRSDLIPIFSDLPAITDANTPATIPHAAGIPAEATFTSSEIEENYRSGKRIKLGITMLMLLPVLATMPVNTFISGIAFSVFLATVIMLYVLKLGPKSWHQPSPQALARQRQRQIAQAEAMKVQATQLANAQQMAQRQLLRQQQQAEIADAALDVANQYIQRLRNRHRHS